ncbi:VWA domain-containing protein [Vibrio parahaemolyticus]|nr:VWA domain-containing protein [Vibrio parahaemolyticus]
MNKQTQLLKNSLPMIGAGLGDKLGVRITVSGTGAWTDGSTINIPDFQITSKEQKNAVLGYMSHEAAHIKFDSFKNINIYALNTNPLRKAMWNIFEDLRIETAMIESMIGTQSWINQIWINRQNGGREVITQDAEAPTALTEYLLMKCRFQFRQQHHLQPYFDAAEEVFLYCFGWKLLSKLNALLDTRLGKLTSSEEAYNLAVEVEQMIQHHEPEEPEQEEPEPEQDDEEQPSESEQSDSNTSESDSNENDSGEGEASNQGDSESDDETGDGENQGQNQGDNSQESNTTNAEKANGNDADQESSSNESTLSNQAAQQGGEPSDEKLKQAIQRLLNASNTEFKDDMDEFAASMEMLADANPEPNRVPVPEVDKVKATQSVQSTALTSTVRQTSNAISGKLQGLVQEHQRVISKTTKRGRKINSKVLHRPSCGDSRLFLNKTEKKEIDTIVEIALDNSGSMYHQGLMATAKEAQLALALALSKINGVSIAASAFPSEYSNSKVMELLSEDESINLLAKRLTHATGSGDCTPSASAMWHCIRTVISSRRNKKVILFITDGHPSSGQSSSLESLVRKAEQAGIMVIGIAIGNIANEKARFHQYFKLALFIKDIRDLKSQLFSLAKDILID